MSALYKNIVTAKTGLAVPEYKSGRAAHSKYDPQREAETFGQETGGASFAVILGIAGGFHIDSFLKRNPDCKIIAVEKSAQDIAWLKENVPLVKELSKKRDVIFCAADFSSDTTPTAASDALEQVLLQNYFPAHYGAISILPLRSWLQEIQDDYEKILERIKSALKKISADYSTQAHFGRLWTKNIFCNLSVLNKIQKSGQDKASLAPNVLQKTAAIIAAGPSLDQSVKAIQEARDNYFVIATDTALKAFGRRGIKVDAVVSLDAQYLSAEHFNGANSKDTIFVLDLAANPSIAKNAQSKNARIVFFDSGHPLVSFASRYCKRPFAKLRSGGGTVAICAADFARQCGFAKIKIFGADFGYSKGKPYTKGTYLDDLYMAAQTRPQNAESLFTKLMFRTELNKNQRGFLQSPTLLRYQTTMEEFLGDYEWKDSVYEWKACDLSQKPQNAPLFEANGLDFASLKKDLDALVRDLDKAERLEPQESLILPEMAYWRQKMDKNGQNKISIKELKKLALNNILLYNKSL